MVMTNAERQARFRERLRQRASLDSLGVKAREAVDRAIAALWAFYSRSGPDDRIWGDIDDFETPAAFRAGLARNPDDLVMMCRDITAEDGATADELATFATIIEMADAITLAAERPMKAPKTRR